MNALNDTGSEHWDLGACVYQGGSGLTALWTFRHSGLRPLPQRSWDTSTVPCSWASPRDEPAPLRKKHALQRAATSTHDHRPARALNDVWRPYCIFLIIFPTHSPLTVLPSSSHTSNVVFSLILSVYSSLFYFTEKKRSHQHVFTTKFTSLRAKSSCLPACLRASLPASLYSTCSCASPYGGQALPWGRGPHPLTHSKLLLLWLAPLSPPWLLSSFFWNTFINWKATCYHNSPKLFFLNFLIWKVSNSQKTCKNNTISTCIPFTYINIYGHAAIFCSLFCRMLYLHINGSILGEFVADIITLYL